MSETPQEKIIDAEVEPLGKSGSGAGRSLRIMLYLLAAVALSVAIAIGYHFAVSGRLDELLGRAAPSSAAPRQAETAPTAAAPAPSVVPMSPRDTRLDQLESRFSSLTASLERLQQLPAANAADPQKLQEIEQHVLALRAALETSAAQRTALQGQVAELQGRMTALSEARLASLREPFVQLIGWSELRVKADRGEKFVNEATQLGQYAEAQGGNLKATFAALQPFAETGAPAKAVLVGDFDEIYAEQQKDAEQKAVPVVTGDRSWWQRSLDKISGLISVRRVGEGEAALPSNFWHAAMAVRSGNLAAAVNDLSGGPVELVPALKEWRDAAEKRVKLDAALDSYGAALRAHLTVQ
jgi:hypothetical protein